MAFTITAELPLGTYRGRHPDGTTDRIPSVARLHAALLCAAGFGPRATEQDGELVPGDADVAALRWLEGNPPDSVSIPALQVNTGHGVAYRDDGTIARTKTSASIRKLAKPAGVSVAVDGCFRWSWSSPPPPEVVESLRALCPDVAYLGTTESPVCLAVDDTENGDAENTADTHQLDRDAGLFHPTGIPVQVPTPGRTQELSSAHARLRGRPPSLAQDKVRGTEASSAASLPRESVGELRYVPVDEPAAEAPWRWVLLLPLDVRVPDAAKVRWAIAAHRALIGLVGDGAPALLTGAYPPGVARPANRVALQILDPDHVKQHYGVGENSTLAILLPAGDHADVAVIREAASRLQKLRVRRDDTGAAPGQANVDSTRLEVAANRFWRPPAAGMLRLWQTWPSAVPDTRGKGPEWTFAHAALLSLGFVWQGSTRLPRVDDGARRDRGIVEAVCAARAAVVRTEIVHTTRPQDHVHKINQYAVVRPYRAILSVGALGGDGLLQAVGQSRHLGGGLLVPNDVPEGTEIERIGWASRCP